MRVKNNVVRVVIMCGVRVSFIWFILQLTVIGYGSLASTLIDYTSKIIGCIFGISSGISSPLIIYLR